MAAAASGASDTIPFIDFPNTDVRQVLEFYETLTGKKVLYDSTVQGNVHVRVARPVARAEAIRILETAFALNNFTLIPGPGEIVKVINQGKNVRQFNIPIFSEMEQLPKGEQAVSFLFKLEYADPQEVKMALDQVVAPTPSLTSIVALPKSQAVLVTETAGMIRNIAQIVAKLDSKPAEVVSEFFVLERADAKEVVEKLGKMFEKPGATNGPAAAAPGMPAPAPGNPAAITLSEDSLIVGKIRIEADLRTNRVHVVTRPVNLPFLRSVIAELDSGLPLGEPATRPLRFVLAGDVLDVVAGAVAEPGVEVKKLENGAASGGAANPLRDSMASLADKGNAASGNARTASLRGAAGITPGAFGAGRGAPQADTAPEGRIIRNTRIIADNRTNAIIVVGNEEMKRKVFKLLDQIDVRAPQVMLTAVIGELTLEGDEQFGLDFLFHKGNLGSAAGSTGLPVSVPGMERLNGVNLKNMISAASLPSTGGGVSAFIGAARSLDILVSALESTGRFRVTSRPMIFTSNNRAAVISSGESIAVPSTINSSYGNGNNLVSTASVDYIDVALKLSVLPLINSEGEVTLQISQEANNTNGSTTISGNTIPTVTTRSIDTTVSVANEATVVLGGLVSEQKQITRSGIPVLHKLPLVGPLFGSKKKSTKRTELIVLIRPTVTQGPVEAESVGRRVLQKTSFQNNLDASLNAPKDLPKKKGARSFAAPRVSLRPEE